MRLIVLLILKLMSIICSSDGPHLAMLVHKDVIYERLRIEDFIKSLEKIDSFEPFTIPEGSVVKLSNIYCTKITTQFSDYESHSLRTGLEAVDLPHAILIFSAKENALFILSFTLTNNYDQASPECSVNLVYTAIEFNFNLLSQKTDVSFNSTNHVSIECNCPPTVDKTPLIAEIEKKQNVFKSHIEDYLSKVFQEGKLFRPQFIPNMNYNVFGLSQNFKNTLNTNPILFEGNFDYVLSYFDGKPLNSEEPSTDIKDYTSFDLTSGDQIQIYYENSVIKNNFEFIENGVNTSSFFEPMSQFDLQLSLYIDDLGKFMPYIFNQYLRRQKIIISQALNYKKFYDEPIPGKLNEYRMIMLTCFNISLYLANTESQIIQIGLYISFNVDFRIENCSVGSARNSCLVAYIGNELRLENIYVNNNSYVNLVELEKLFYSKVIDIYKLLMPTPIFSIDFNYTISLFSIRKGGLFFGLQRKNIEEKEKQSKEGVNREDL